MASAAIAMQASKATNPHGVRIAQFDTDTEEIGINNRCSARINHKIEDFVGPDRVTGKAIKGFEGSRTEKH